MSAYPNFSFSLFAVSHVFKLSLLLSRHLPVSFHPFLFHYFLHLLSFRFSEINLILYGSKALRFSPIPCLVSER